MFAGGVLKKGKYVLLVKASWKFWDDHEIVLSAYGEKQLTVEPMEKDPNFLTDIFLERARKNKERKNYGDSYPGIQKCHEISVKEG